MRTICALIARTAPRLARVALTASLVVVAGLLMTAPLGCSKPRMPSLTGPGALQDLTQIRKGQSPNEVRRIMGSDYRLVYEEGLQGADMGIYVWEYPKHGKIYFNTSGVFKVVPY